MKRFLRFVILGYYSPSLYTIGSEPWPAPTLAGRWRQWRGRGAWRDGGTVGDAWCDGFREGAAR